MVPQLNQGDPEDMLAYFCLYLRLQCLELFMRIADVVYNAGKYLWMFLDGLAEDFAHMNESLPSIPPSHPANDVIRNDVLQNFPFPVGPPSKR